MSLANIFASFQIISTFVGSEPINTSVQRLVRVNRRLANRIRVAVVPQEELHFPVVRRDDGFASGPLGTCDMAERLGDGVDLVKSFDEGE